MQVRLGGFFFSFTRRTPHVLHLASSTSRVPPPALAEASLWKRPASAPTFPYGNMAPPCAGAARRRATARLASFRRARSLPATPLRRETWRLRLSHAPRLSVQKHGVALRRAGASWLRAASPLPTRMSDCGGRSPPEAGGRSARDVASEGQRLSRPARRTSLPARFSAPAAGARTPTPRQVRDADTEAGSPVAPAREARGQSHQHCFAFSRRVAVMSGAGEEEAGTAGGLRFSAAFVPTLGGCPGAPRVHRLIPAGPLPRRPKQLFTTVSGP